MTVNMQKKKITWSPFHIWELTAHTVCLYNFTYAKEHCSSILKDKEFMQCHHALHQGKYYADMHFIQKKKNMDIHTHTLSHLTSTLSHAQLNSRGAQRCCKNMNNGTARERSSGALAWLCICMVKVACGVPPPGAPASPGPTGKLGRRPKKILWARVVW